MDRKLTVFVWLNGQFVRAGRMLSRKRENGSHQCSFLYFKEYLNREDAFSIDPVNLPLESSSDKFYFTPDEQDMVVFGSMRDASPDFWGRSRMERRTTKKLDDYDFILASGDDRFGAMAFAASPSADSPLSESPWGGGSRTDRVLNIESVELLAKEVEETSNHKLTEEEEKLLLKYGSSLGGARPKITVRDGKSIWLAKISRDSDRTNCVRGEYAAMNTASRMGLTVPDIKLSQISGREVYLIKRFDREIDHDQGVRRLHAISALTAFNITDNSYDLTHTCSYNLLAERISNISEDPKQDLLELYHRIFFNCLIGNNDDHARNHAFLLTNAGWRLSPLYDVTPATTNSFETLAMKFGDEGAVINRRNLLSRANDFGLSQVDAEKILDDMTRKFSSLWEQEFLSAGIDDQEMSLYRRIISANIERIKAHWSATITHPH